MSDTTKLRKERVRWGLMWTPKKLKRGMAAADPAGPEDTVYSTTQVDVYHLGTKYSYDVPTSAVEKMFDLSSPFREGAPGWAELTAKAAQA